MSKHCWVLSTNIGKIRVEAGFDRIQGGFFMNVMEVGRDAEGFLYDSLTDAALADVSGYPRSLTQYVSVLEKKGISLPARMVDELLHDQMRLVGNRIVVYAEDGTITSDAR